MCLLCKTDHDEKRLLSCGSKDCKNKIHMYCLETEIYTIQSEHFYCPLCVTLKNKNSINVNVLLEYISKNNERKCNIKKCVGPN